MSTLDRDGGKKQKLKNLMKRGGVWYFKKMVQGKLKSVSLNTSDVELAKARRNELSKQALNEKWEAIDQVRTKRNIATIGEVIGRYEPAKQLQLGAGTVRGNVWALRFMLRHGLGKEGDVDGLPVSVLDGALVRGWQAHCLKEAGTDKLKLNTAAVSANSVLRQARSVFGRKPVKHAIYQGLVLPNLDGFMKSPMLEELKCDNYQKPAVEVLERIWEAAEQLKETNPRLWLIFWLAAETGLRRGEIIHMRFHWFRRNPAKVRLCFETDFVPKGKREREVPVKPGVEAECRRVAESLGWGTEAGDYVLAGLVSQKLEWFKEFGRWLAAQGWPRRQKAHELRKIFASDFLETADPYDAQLALGHQDLKTTARYAARREVKATDQAARYGVKSALSKRLSAELSKQCLDN